MVKSHELVPTNTTRTAAYVGVATNVSVLLVRIPIDSSDANNVTATDTVTKLLIRSLEGRLIMSMGTTNEAPPEKAIMKRVTLSTKGEIVVGGLPARKSSKLDSISDFVYVRRLGKILLRACLRGSEAIRPAGEDRVQYRELKSPPSRSAISGNAFARSRCRSEESCCGRSCKERRNA